MNQKTGLFAVGVAFAATVALAHNGATGIVLERMKSMTAMRDVMRDLTPIIQGAVPYDALAVSEAGYVIAAHSGKTMRALFPDNSLSGVTYAKPKIWADWQEFASLADDLRVYGEALTSVAPVGLQPPVPEPTMPDQPMTPNSQDDRIQQIATLMGYATPTSVEFTSGSTSPEPDISRPLSVAVRAEEVFAKISGTCSACHAKFRRGRN